MLPVVRNPSLHIPRYVFYNNRVPLLQNKTPAINWMSKHIPENGYFLYASIVRELWTLITAFSLNIFLSSSFSCILKCRYNVLKLFFLTVTKDSHLVEEFSFTLQSWHIGILLMKNKTPFWNSSTDSFF